METIQTVLVFDPKVSCELLVRNLEPCGDYADGKFVERMTSQNRPNSQIGAREIVRIADEVDAPPELRVSLLEMLLELSPSVSAQMFREIGASVAEVCSPLLRDPGEPREPLSQALNQATRLSTRGRLSEEDLCTVWEQSDIHRVAELAYASYSTASMAHALWAFVNAAFDSDGDAPTSLVELIENCRDAYAKADGQYLAAKRLAETVSMAEKTWQSGTRLDFYFIKEATEQHLRRLLDEIKSEQSETVNGKILAAMLSHLMV